MSFFLASIFQLVVLVVGTNQSPAEKYLVGTGELFIKWLDTRHITDDPAQRLLFVNELNGAIANAIGSALPERSLSNLAHALEDRMRNQDGFTLSELSAAIMASVNLDMSAILDFTEPLSGSRSLALASRIGMSLLEIRMTSRVSSQIEGGLPARLDLIESKIAMLSGVNNGAVIKEISQLTGNLELSRFHTRFNTMCADLRLKGHLVPQIVSIESIREVEHFVGNAHNYVAMGSGVAETCRDLLYRMMEIMVQITPEQLGNLSVEISRVWAEIESIRMENDGVYDFHDTLVIVDRLTPLVDELQRLLLETSGGALQNQEAILMNELNGLEDVDPVLHIALIPKMKGLIKFACLVHLNPAPFLLLQRVIRATVRVIIIEQNDAAEIHRKRIAISSFLDSLFDNFSTFAHSTGPEYEAFAIKLAFICARKLEFRLLAEYPELLPGWSIERLTLVRKIIASFLYVDGPYDWESNAVHVALPIASEAQLRHAVSVIYCMHENRRLDQSPIFDKAPLYTPGSWLREFLAHPLEAPTLYVALIQGSLQKPYLKLVMRNIFFPEFRDLVTDYSEIPQRFASMANRINAISLNYRAGMDHYLESALSLPRDLFRVEMNSGRIHSNEESPIVNLVEQSVNSFFSVIEAFGGLVQPHFLLTNEIAISQCRRSLSALIRHDIVVMDQNEALGQAIQTLISHMDQLTQALRSNLEVNDHGLCAVSFTP